MDIKNLVFVKVLESALRFNEREYMMFRTFDTFCDVKKYIDKCYHDSTRSECGAPTPSFFGLDRFVKYINSSQINDVVIIPVFIKEAAMSVPVAPMEKLSQNEENALKTKENGVKKSFTSQMEEIYIDAYDEITKRIKEHGNMVKVGDNVYSISESNELMMNGKVVESSHYGYCQIFDAIMKALDVEKIVKKVQLLDVEDITTIMRTIGEIGKDDKFCHFDELEYIISESNAKGMNIKINITSGYDRYLYCRMVGDKTICIDGLSDDFVKNTFGTNWANKIINNDSYLAMVNGFVFNCR